MFVQNGDRRAALRRTLLVASTLVLVFLVASSALRSEPTETPPPRRPLPRPESADMRELAYEAALVAAAAGGFVFPRTLNVTTQYSGRWAATAGVDAASVSPDVVPNRSLVYRVRAGADLVARSTSPLAGRSGDAIMALESFPVYDRVLGVQAVRGALIFFDGAESDGRRGVATGVHGRYYADGGLLFAVGSLDGGDVALVPPRVPPPVPLVDPESNHSAPAVRDPNATAVLTDDGSSDSASRDSGVSSSSSSEVPAEEASEDEGAGKCILLLALRSRPVGFDPSWRAQPPPLPPPTGRAAASTLGAQAAFRELLLAAFPDVRNEPAIAADAAVLSEAAMSAFPVADADDTWERYAALLDRGRHHRMVASGNSALWRVVCTAAADVLGAWRSVASLLVAPASTPAQGPVLPRASSAPPYLRTQPTSSARWADVAAVPAVAVDAAEGSPLLVRQAGVGTSGSGGALRRAALDSSATADHATGGRRLLSTSAPQHWIVAGDELSARVDGGSPRALGVDPPVLPAARRLEAAAAVNGVYAGLQFVPLYGHAVSPNCNLSFDVALVTALVDTEFLEVKALFYSMFLLAVGTALFFSAFHQLVRSMSESVAFRVSLVSVGLQSVMDGCIFCGHLFVALSQPQAIMLGLVSSSMLFASMFVILGFRMMLLIEKAQRPAYYEGGLPALVRRSWVLRRRLVAALLLVLGASWLLGLGWIHALCIAFMSLWVPQIVHSVAHDCRPGVAPAYLWTTSVARAALPLYFLLCPSNILYFLVPPEPLAAARVWAERAAAGPFGAPFADRPGVPWTALGPLTYPGLASPARAVFFGREVALGAALVVWVLVQAVVVTLQGKTGWGPRFFIPAPFLPRRYDYHRVIRVREGRVQPDPLATAEHVTLPAAAAQLPAADADPGARGYQTRLQQAWLSAAAAVATASSNMRWFLAGCREVVAQWGRRRQPPPAGSGGRPTAQQAATGGGSWLWWTGRPRLVYQRISDEGDSAAGGANAAGAAEAVPPSVPIAGAAGGDDADAENPAATPVPAALAAAAADPALDEVVGGDDAAATPAAVDCVVCMEPVALPLARRAYMVTPCDHLFHAGCLAPWLEQRLECPTCRMRLPEPTL